MANVCTFSMRIRGAERKCVSFMDSPLGVYEIQVTEQKGSGNDCMVQLDGECRWSVHTSMIDQAQTPLRRLSERYGIEVEVFGYDKSEPEWLEHYHYICGRIVRESMSETIDVEDYDKLPEEKKAFYEKTLHGDMEYYDLKPQYAEPFEWDEKQNEMRLHFTMSFEELGLARTLPEDTQNSAAGWQECTEDNAIISTPYFKITKLPGFLCSRNVRETYEQGDYLLMFFNEDAGAEPEKDCFGRIQNGLELQVNLFIDVTDAAIQSQLQNIREEHGHKDFTVFAEAPGFCACAYTEKNEGIYVRIYGILTRKVMITGAKADRFPANLIRYDRMMRTIMPAGEKQQGEGRIETGDPAPAESSQEEQARHAVLRAMDNALFMIQEKKKKAEKLLKGQEALDKRLESVRASCGQNTDAAKEMVDRAKGKLQEIKDKIRQEEQALGSLGIFAMSKKNECKARIEALRKQLPAAETEVRKAEAQMSKNEENLRKELALAKADQRQEFDSKQWQAYKDELTKIEKAITEQQKEIRNNSAAIPETWDAPQLPDEPPITEKEMDYETLALIVEEVLRYSDPMTLQDISQADHRLSGISLQKIGAAIRGMGIKVEKTTRMGQSYYTIRSGY